MSQIVRAAILQTSWTGSKDTMIDEHERQMREAAKQGAQIICFQELFYGPYFCQVQDTKFYEYTEEIPNGPTTKRFQALAKELGMVTILPMYEVEQAGLLYNTAAIIDADGTYLGKYRKQHIPQTKGFLEKFYFRPGNGGYPVFDTAVGKVGIYICYDRHFPEGWRALGLNGAQLVFNPSATSRGLSSYLWKLEQPASAVANEYFIGAINRVGIEELGDNDFYGTSIRKASLLARSAIRTILNSSSVTSTSTSSRQCAIGGRSTVTVAPMRMVKSCASSQFVRIRSCCTSRHRHHQRQ
jgi:beta-ureidopropionase